MKMYLAILLLFTGILPSHARKTGSTGFILTGGIINSKSPFVYLLYTDSNGNEIKDSCFILKGMFSFKGNIAEPTWAILKANSTLMDDAVNKNIVSFFLEPGAMTATVQYDRFEEMILTGSDTQKEYVDFSNTHSLINKKHSDSLYERHSKLTEEYILSHPGSYISAYQLSTYKGRWSKTTVNYLYTRLTPGMQKSSYGKKIKAFLDESEANAEGKKARDFSAATINGNTIQLSDFKEKYVILDFWGSWCVPCRKSTPHLIELFKNYSSKGFTVIAIAEEYDKTGIAWKEAIQKDGTGIWNNILSNPGMGDTNKSEKTLADKFGVHVFPTKLLIDPSGYIIGRFEGTGREAELDKQLKEIYN